MQKKLKLAVMVCFIASTAFAQTPQKSEQETTTVHKK